jgi:hypothetical protein
MSMTNMGKKLVVTPGAVYIKAKTRIPRELPADNTIFWCF